MGRKRDPRVRCTSCARITHCIMVDCGRRKLPFCIKCYREQRYRPFWQWMQTGLPL